MPRIAGRRARAEEAEPHQRVGGMWRYVMVANGGFEVAFHGEYREIVPNQRIVTTEVYEGMPEAEEQKVTSEDDDGVVLNTVTFTEVDGRTILTLLVSAPSQEVRDMIVNSGMEVGMQEQMDVLEQIAISLR